MTLLGVLIAALACYRLTSLLVDEGGPWDVFGHLRDKVGISYDEHSQPVGTNMAARMLMCHKCTSVWVGIGLAALLALNPLTAWLMLPFSLSAVSIIITIWDGHG